MVTAATKLDGSRLEQEHQRIDRGAS
jgi:hypothetical protein